MIPRLLPIPKDGGNSPFKYGRKRARKIFRGIIFNNIWFHRQVLGRTIGLGEVYFWAVLSDMSRGVRALSGSLDGEGRESRLSQMRPGRDERLLF